MKNPIKFLICAALLCMSVACDKNGEDTDSYLKLSTDEITVSNASGSQSITVYSSSQWQSMNANTWCTVSPARGEKGNMKITVTFEQNTSDKTRTAVITFINQTGNCKLTVTQSATASNPDDGDDDPADTHEDAAANRWAYSELSEWYLYNTELKSTTPATYNKDCETFLSDLLLGLKTNVLDGGTYSDGEKYIYSYITRYDNSTRATQSFDPTYGFDFLLDYASDTGYDLYARVLYVLPDSPADKAGLKRGDKILKVNGKTITLFNYEDLIYDYMLYPSSGSSLSITLQNGSSLSMSTANIPNTPIVCNKVITHEGKKIGYLMFNAFETGYASDGSSHEYEDQLEEIFSDFRAEGVSEMVLDLRYNGGGYLSTAQLLASLMAPADKLGNIMAQLMYNDEITEKYSEDYLGSKMYFLSSAAGKTIGMTKIYVLATDMSASASEEVINALRGIDVDIVHIGTTTEGKNVGMDYFGTTSGAYYYEMWPVTFISANAKGFYQYENGFTPQYEYDEWYDEQWYELGDEREALLSIALDLIDGKTPSLQNGTRSALPARRLSGQKPHGRISGLLNNVSRQSAL